MQLSRENLKKPSEKKWKKIADYLLYTGLPAVNAFFITMQATGAFDIKVSFWGISITTLLITLFKGLTKFTAEPEV